MKILPQSIWALSAHLPQDEGEDYEYYLMFVQWVAMGAPKVEEFADTQDQYLPRTIVKASKDHRWHYRLKNAPAAAKAADLMAKRIEEYTMRLTSQGSLSAIIVELLRSTLTKIIMADMSEATPVINPKDYATLLKSVHEYERLEENKSTQNIAAALDNGPDPKRLESMSVDDMLTIKRLLPELLPEPDPED